MKLTATGCNYGHEYRGLKGGLGSFMEVMSIKGFYVASMAGRHLHVQKGHLSEYQMPGAWGHQWQKVVVIGPSGRPYRMLDWMDLPAKPFLRRYIVSLSLQPRE